MLYHKIIKYYRKIPIVTHLFSKAKSVKCGRGGVIIEIFGEKTPKTEKNCFSISLEFERLFKAENLKKENLC